MTTENKVVNAEIADLIVEKLLNSDKFVDKLTEAISKSDLDKKLKAITSVKNMMSKLLDFASGRKLKPADWPEGPKTGYFIFRAEKYNELKRHYRSKGKDVSSKKINRILNKMWNELSKEKKDEYNARGKQDKERYDREVAQWEKKRGITIDEWRERKMFRNLGKSPILALITAAERKKKRRSRKKQRYVDGYETDELEDLYLQAESDTDDEIVMRKKKKKSKKKVGGVDKVKKVDDDTDDDLDEIPPSDEELK